MRLCCFPWPTEAENRFQTAANKIMLSQHRRSAPVKAPIRLSDARNCWLVTGRWFSTSKHLFAHRRPWVDSTLKVPIELFANLFSLIRSSSRRHRLLSQRQIFENVSDKFLRSDAKLCATMSKGHQRKSQCKQSLAVDSFVPNTPSSTSFVRNSVPYRLRSLHSKPRRLETSVLRATFSVTFHSTLIDG